MDNLVTLGRLVCVPRDLARCLDSVMVDPGQRFAFDNSLEEELSQKVRISRLRHPLRDPLVPCLEVPNDDKVLLSPTYRNIEPVTVGIEAKAPRLVARVCQQQEHQRGFLALGGVDGQDILAAKLLSVEGRLDQSPLRTIRRDNHYVFPLHLVA